MSDDVVSRAKAALEGVTPGPWEWEFPDRGDDALRSTTVFEPYSRGYIDPQGRPGYPKFVLSGEWHNDDTAGICGDGADYAFVAAARSLVPELVAEVERLRALVGEQ